MKPRKVVLTVESKCSIPIRVLRDKSHLCVYAFHKGTWTVVPIDQIQVNVVK